MIRRKLRDDRDTLSSKEIGSLQKLILKRANGLSGKEVEFLIRANKKLVARELYLARATKTLLENIEVRGRQV